MCMCMCMCMCVCVIVCVIVCDCMCDRVQDCACACVRNVHMRACTRGCILNPDSPSPRWLPTGDDPRSSLAAISTTGRPSPARLLMPTARSRAAANEAASEES